MTYIFRCEGIGCSFSTDNAYLFGLHKVSPHNWPVGSDMANFSRAKEQGQRVKCGITVSGPTKIVNTTFYPNTSVSQNPSQSLNTSPSSSTNYVSTDIRQKKNICWGTVSKMAIKNYYTKIHSKMWRRRNQPRRWFKSCLQKGCLLHSVLWEEKVSPDMPEQYLWRGSPKMSKLSQYLNCSLRDPCQC